jgi:hypothetical protein
MLVFRILLFLIFLSPLKPLAQTWRRFNWETGQVLAVSQREREPSTVLFEFLTGSRYGHVGLVVMENNYPWVYEATHPTIQKVSLEEFFEKVTLNDKGEKEFTLLKPFMSLESSEEEALKAFVNKHFDARTQYNYAGTKTPGRLNCAEFVHEAFRSAGIKMVGSYEEARHLNLESLQGKIMALWGKDHIKESSLIMSPFSIVTSPWMEVVSSNLPHHKVLSDRELYLDWVRTESFEKFKARFPAVGHSLDNISGSLSQRPQARYPQQCGELF